jgi:Tol biopolymer transport system component
MGGFVDFATNGNFMINVGRIDTNVPIPSEPPPATVDEINLSAGEITVWWQTARSNGYFPAFYQPHLSSDEQFVAFYLNERNFTPETLYIIDRTGHEYIQYSNSIVMQWRPNGDLMVVEVLPTGLNRLVLLSLNGTAQPVWTAPGGAEITGMPFVPDMGGAWSPNGRFFLFTTEDRTAQTSHVYLWQVGEGEPKLLYTATGDRNIGNLTWLPGSQAVYFSVGSSPDHSQELWRYDVEGEN